MKKGIRGHDVVASGLKNIDQKCFEAGIDYIQLVLEKSIDGFKTGDFSEEYAEKIRQELPNTKVAILGSYINPSDPDEDTLAKSIAAFKEKIRYATVLKPIAVGTETGSYIEGKTHSEEAYQHLLKTIKELVAEAEKYNVDIAIEGVLWFVINSPEIMARLMNDVNSDNIKVIFDPCNLLSINNYTVQDKMINDMFDLVGEKIVAIHAKDFVVENGEFKGTMPGKGMLNYKLIFKRMKEINPDIPVICEGIDDEAAKEAFDILADIEKAI